MLKLSKNIESLFAGHRKHQYRENRQGRKDSARPGEESLARAQVLTGIVIAVGIRSAKSIESQ